METDRQQLRGKRDQQLHQHLGLRQPWWGRGSAPTSLPQIQRFLSAPNIQTRRIWWVARVTKGDMAALAPEAPVFCFQASALPLPHSCLLLSFWRQQTFQRWAPGPREGPQAPSSEGISHWRWILECSPPEANLALCSVAVSLENLAGAVTSHCLGKELEAEPRGNSVNDGVYCSLIWHYTDIINLWLQALSSLTRRKESWLSPPMGYFWKLKVGERGPGIQIAQVHFPCRAARRSCLSVSVSSEEKRGCCPGVIWGFALLGIAREHRGHLRIEP